MKSTSNISGADLIYIYLSYDSSSGGDTSPRDLGNPGLSRAYRAAPGQPFAAAHSGNLARVQAFAARIARADVVHRLYVRYGVFPDIHFREVDVRRRRGRRPVGAAPPPQQARVGDDDVAGVGLVGVVPLVAEVTQTVTLA